MFLDSQDSFTFFGQQIQLQTTKSLMLQNCCLLGGKAETIAGAVLGKACFLLYTIVLTPGDYSGDESNQRELNFPFLAYTIRAIC